MEDFVLCIAVLYVHLGRDIKPAQYNTLRANRDTC